MIKYKNISGKIMTFHGVTFNPNEIKEVPGYINHIKMIRIKETKTDIPKPKAIISLPKEEQPEAKIVQPQTTKRNYNKRKK